ncbi:MAG: nuclear transport factor 2 family protein [Saprospiraceae bacterium]|nr:nuclear transport factor 2 family protein [Saprospiraceae bacterium]
MENKNVIDNLYKAFAIGDIPVVLGSMDEKIVWYEAEGNMYADRNPYIGPDAVLQGVFGRIMEDHEYFNLTNIETHNMDNDKVLATLRYNGKVKKNGAEYDAQVAHLWSLKDGKIVAFQQYVDTKKLDDAMNS